MMTVINQAPVITSLSNSSPVCGGANEGQEVTISGTFTDADPDDTHVATIDGGDGIVTDAVIVGNCGDDILIAGTTLWDRNDAALLAIMDEWTSSRSFTARVNNLRGIDNPEFGNRLNSNSAAGIDYFLSPDGEGQAGTPTVFDDSERDILTDGLDQDWFLADIVHGEEDSGVRDWIADLSRVDLADDLKFILSAGEG